MQGLIINDNVVKIARNAELVHNALDRLLFSELNVMPGALDKGSRIPDYLDEPANEENILGIMSEVRTLIETYEPRIVLEEIAVDITPTNGTVGVVIYLKWHFAEDPDESFESLLDKVFIVN